MLYNRVQISIFNPDTEVPEVDDSSNRATKNDGSNDFSEMVKNFTDAFRSETVPSTLCRDSDLYALAKHARLIAYELPQLPGFMQQLISDMMSFEPEGDDQEPSSFAPLYDNREFAKQSRLESSWTIRTDVDDEINYFGPPEPLFFAILR